METGYGRRGWASRTNTKENIRTTKSADMEFSRGQAATSIRATMKMIVGKATGKCTGMMAAFTRANGRRAFSTARERFSFLGRATRKASFRTTF